eukprot:6438889-Amphidinium_carterae.1
MCSGTKKNLVPSNGGGASQEHAVAPRSFMPCGCWVCNKCEAITFKYVVPDHGQSLPIATDEDRQ